MVDGMHRTCLLFSMFSKFLAGSVLWIEILNVLSDVLLVGTVHQWVDHVHIHAPWLFAPNWVLTYITMRKWRVVSVLSITIISTPIKPSYMQFHFTKVKFLTILKRSICGNINLVFWNNRLLNTVMLDAVRWSGRVLYINLISEALKARNAYPNRVMLHWMSCNAINELHTIHYVIDTLLYPFHDLDWFTFR